MKASDKFDLLPTEHGHVVPFAKKGDTRYEWVEPYIFRDSLEFSRYIRRRTSMVMLLRSKTNDTTYPVFWSIFERLLKEVDSGPVACWTRYWCFVRYGESYSVKPDVFKQSELMVRKPVVISEYNEGPRISFPFNPEL